MEVVHLSSRGGMFHALGAATEILMSRKVLYIINAILMCLGHGLLFHGVSLKHAKVFIIKGFKLIITTSNNHS